MQTKITGTVTWDHFIGSGATSYPWYGVESHRPERDDWILRFRASDDETGRVYVLDHTRVMRTLVKCARAYLRHVDGTALPAWCQYVSVSTLREAYVFLADPDYADFDAASADEILQVAAFGKVIYR